MGRESWRSRGIHAILFASQKPGYPLAVTRYWTSFSPSGALINTHSRSESRCCCVWKHPLLQIPEGICSFDSVAAAVTFPAALID